MRWESRTAAVIATQRRGRTQENELVSGLAKAWTTGQHVDWPTFFAGTEARRTDLPTYAFQHQRYWLNATATSGDVSSVGQVAAVDVAADGDPLCLQVDDERRADRSDRVLVDLGGVDAADVVGLEDVGVDVHSLL